MLVWDQVCKPGVIYGEELARVFQFCKDNSCALPAVNCINSDTVNTVMEAAKKVNTPIIIQFSVGGSSFFAGKGSGLDNTSNAIMGAIAGAYHVHTLAERYGVSVILHTDHCSEAHLPWLDGLIEANEQFFASFKRPLFSSHMLDLSDKPLNYNLEISKKYFQKLAKLAIHLEVEIGITGGEEDGVDNSDKPESELYTKSEDINELYTLLNEISPYFTVAAAFGNVHGVYQPGNVKLKPEILRLGQEFIKEKHQLNVDKPISYVFHGGSGSTADDIAEAVSYGVVKMNLDTDIQWSNWEGVLRYYHENEHYLQSQLGNPEGENKPNKSKYDPRVWIRKGQENSSNRIIEYFKLLKAVR